MHQSLSLSLSLYQSPALISKASKLNSHVLMRMALVRHRAHTQTHISAENPALPRHAPTFRKQTAALTIQALPMGVRLAIHALPRHAPTLNSQVVSLMRCMRRWRRKRRRPRPRRHYRGAVRTLGGRPGLARSTGRHLRFGQQAFGFWACRRCRCRASSRASSRAR